MSLTKIVTKAALLMLLSYGGVASAQYVLNNPLRWTDPTGLDVTITINRTTYTPNSIGGTIDVTSTVTDKTFSGNTLENRQPPRNPALPVPPGEYSAFVRTDRTPNRIQLIDVPKATFVQIHNGNIPEQAEGCFLAGTTASRDRVGNSIDAMIKINDIIRLDGSGNITVIVNGGAKGP